MTLNHNQEGFSLIELLIIIIIIGIMTALAMQSMTVLVQDSRSVKTEREMEMLSKAIVGDAGITNGGVRSDFGYFGDIGAFPSSLQNLYTNPGGYTTWDGPYIKPGFSEDIIGFKTDEWGTTYAYAGGVTLSSTGSGSTITKTLAAATSDYLLNTVTGVVKDSTDCPPDTTYADSIDIVITVPDGAGGTMTKTYKPIASGAFTLDSLPVGQHALRIIYKPTLDTLFRYLTVLPRHKSNPAPEYRFASAYFDPILTKESGSDDIKTDNCDEIRFDIENISCANIDLTSLTLTWATPVNYYEEIKIDGATVFSQSVPRSASGDLSTFIVPKTIYGNTTVKVEIIKFNDDSTGVGTATNMANTSFTVLLSDGTTFNVSVGDCSWESGPNYAGTSGTNNFIDPDSAIGSTETSCATFTGTTQDGFWKNFGFAIPAGSIIDGIEVEYKRSWITTPPATTTPGINIGKSELVLATEKIDDKLEGEDSEVCGSGQKKEKFGGKTDLWGLTWTVAEINSPSFTVRLRNVDAVSYDWHVNWIKVSVFYH